MSLRRSPRWMSGLSIRLLTLAAILFLTASPVPVSAGKSGAELRAEVERKIREAKARQEKMRAEFDERARQQGLDRKLTASPSGAPSAASSRPTSSMHRPESASSRVPASGHERPRVQYNFQRGQQFAWHVEVRTARGQGQTAWVGDVFCIAIQANDTASGELMVIGRIACAAWDGAEWRPRPQDDILFRDHLHTRSNTVNGPQLQRGEKTPRRLPLMMNKLLADQKLLFPDLQLFYKPEGDESRGKETYLVTGGDAPFGATRAANADSYHLIKTEHDELRQPTIINKRALNIEQEGLAVAYSQQGTFDVADGMPVDLKLTYVERNDGEFRVDVTTRRKYGVDLEQIKQQALQLYPVAQWPSCVHRVPVASGGYQLGFPNQATALRVGEPIAAVLPVTGGDYRAFRGTVVKILSQDDALVRLDGSHEEQELDYRSLHRFD